MNTREPSKKESDFWERYKYRFENSTAPKMRALVLLAKVARAAQNEYELLTGERFEAVDQESAAKIIELGNYVQILENQITGVLLKKYAVKIDGDEISIVGMTADEGDIMPLFSGFGIAPILIAAGIAAVTLLGGGFVTLKIIETKTQNEAARISERLMIIDKKMMEQPKEKRDQWTKWKEQTAKQTAAAAKGIPGAPGLLSRFLGEKGATIAIAGIIGIAAAYLLIPQLRRN